MEPLSLNGDTQARAEPYRLRQAPSKTEVARSHVPNHMILRVNSWFWMATRCWLSPRFWNGFVKFSEVPASGFVVE
jgi:hypothetical protein